MSTLAQRFDLAPLRLTSGEGRSLELAVPAQPLQLSGQAYAVVPEVVSVRLTVSRTTHDGYALRLRFDAALEGPCMRCLEPSSTPFAIEVREVDQPGADDEELDSPYVEDEVVDLEAWTRDALALAVPSQLLCRRECAGLCAVCGVNLNEQPGHAHEAAPDPRWAKLRELKF